MNVLGDTLAEIAFEKAGILKPKVNAYTVPQKPEATQVIFQRASDVQCNVRVVPNISSLNLKLGLDGDFQLYNASLAIALTNEYLSQHTKHEPIKLLDNVNQDGDSEVCYNSELSNLYIEGLAESKWAGRAQILQIPNHNIKLFLDGAHTAESMEACAQWFQNKNKDEKDSKNILIFGCNSGRDPGVLIQKLKEENIVFNESIISSFDLTDVPKTENSEPLLKREPKDSNWQNTILLKLREKYSEDLGSVSTSISSTFQKLYEYEEKNPNQKLNVLITGSLYLVGPVLQHLGHIIE